MAMGSFGSVKQLIKRIDHFVSHYETASHLPGPLPPIPSSQSSHDFAYESAERHTS
jgi:hypothetical protein